jgi:hypothetical protein
VTGVCDGACAQASGPPFWLSAPVLLQARSGHQLVLGPDGALYAIGGSSNGTVNLALTSVEKLPNGGQSWQSAPSMATARYGLGAAVDQAGAIWAIGGLNGNGGLSTTEALFGGAWGTQTPLPNSHANMPVALLHDGRLLLVDSGTSLLYSPVTKIWSQVPQLRDTCALAVIDDGRAFAIAGENNMSMGVNNLDAFDPTTRTWTPRAPLATNRMAPAGAYAPDGRIYAIGGNNSGALTSVEAYLPSVDRWTSRVAPLAQARFFVAAAVGRDGRVYVAGGTPGGGPNTLATVEVYGPILMLSANGAAAGAMITAMGKNFAASARVGITFDGQPAAVGASDGNGGFQIPFQVPPTVAGAHQVTAIDVRAQYPAQLPFTVN